MTSRLASCVVALLTVCACQAEPILDDRVQAVGAYPGTHNYGTLQVGQTSGPVQFSIYADLYESGQVLAVTSSCADMIIEYPGPQPGEYFYYYYEPEFNYYENVEFYFTVRFAPSVAGTQSCAIVADLSPQADLTFTLSGTGQPPPREITLVQPMSGILGFGQVPINTVSGGIDIIVRNDGGEALTLGSAAVVAGPFTVSAGTAAAIAPGATSAFTVHCAPTEATASTGVFRIVSDDPDEGTIDIALGCTGITSQLMITPGPIAFPPTQVGLSALIDVQIGNAGALGLTVENIFVDDPAFALVTLPTFPMPLAQGAPFTVPLTFTPGLDSEYVGNLTITYDGGQTRTAAISAAGRASGFSITPAGTVDFGPICLGQSASEIFIVLNTGSGDYSLADVATSDPAFAPTLLSPAAYPATITAAGGSVANIQVNAAPTLVGELTGTLTASTDIPEAQGGPTREVALRMVGVPAGVSATPAAVAIGDVVVGAASRPGELTVSNCDVAGLTLQSATITGVDAAAFALVTQPTDPTIPAQGTATYHVQAQPLAAGPLVASLDITHDRGTLSIPLTANGVVVTAPDDRGSYYACQTGGQPGSWAPIAVALAGLWLRRRRRGPHTD